MCMYISIYIYVYVIMYIGAYFSVFLCPEEGDVVIFTIPHHDVILPGCYNIIPHLQTTTTLEMTLS